VTKHTPFYPMHLKANAKMVDFAGWEMPLHYGSQIEEHHRVRVDAGMFDVSHMGIVDFKGKDAKLFLEQLLANDVNKLTVGKALYTCMLNANGGVIDDLIVYQLGENDYRAVINAGRREKDLQWMQSQAADKDVSITERNDLGMLAIQGPKVKDKILKYLPRKYSDLILAIKPFHFVSVNDWFVARTGYTGEDGYEIIFKTTDASKIWKAFLMTGIKPCGLGARDTLRLEAGLNLYGNDMDENITPFEANLTWTVMMDPKERRFTGREALEKQLNEGVKKRLVGLVLKGPGIIRNHQKVYFDQDGEGEITSGGYSPTLEKSIAFARVPKEANEQAGCFVEIRDKRIPAEVVKPPFVKFGKKMV
jgi:aminomethyltransferase